MATRTNPLMTAAAFASAAAIAAATPVIAPSLTTGTATAISQAGVQLAAFADVLRITPNDIFNTYAQGWGGAVYNGNDPAVQPMANACTNSDGTGGVCTVSGLSGVLYLYQDALINGNGLGPSFVNGGEGIPPWNVSAVNYFYEGNAAGFGVSGGIQYLVQTGVAQGNPILAALITAAFGGPAIVATAWTAAWTLIENAVAPIPLVGPLIAGGINAYLNGYGNVGQGLGAVVAYLGDVITNNLPKPSASVPAATSLAASEAAPAAAAVAAVTAPLTGRSATPAPAAALRVAAPAATEAADAPQAPVEAGAPVQTPAESAPAAEQAPAVDAPAAGASATDAPAATPAPSTRGTRVSSAPKRPLRDAVDQAAKRIGAVLGAAKAAGAPDAAGSAETGGAGAAGTAATDPAGAAS